MADNIQITEGAGTPVHADEYSHGTYGAGKSQVIKVTWGPPGTGNDTDVASGKPLPIQIRASGGTEVTFNANGRAAAASSAPIALSNEDKTALDAIVTSTQLMDDTIFTDDAAFTPATSKVQAVGYFVDETATDSADEGDIGASRMTPDRKHIVTVQPHTNGGLSVARILDSDETEDEVKATAGVLYKLRITNRTTTIRYVKLYDATAAVTVVGTTTPLDTIPIPGGGSADLATVITENYGAYGLTFATALSIATTTGFADNDTGAPGANDVIVSAYYK